MKIKEKFIELFRKIKDSIKCFPVTIISIMFLTVVYAVNLNNHFISNNMMGKISVFILLFACGTFLIETLIKANSKKKIIGYVVSAIIAFIFTYLIAESSSFSEIFEFRLARLFYCYIIVLPTLAVYFNYKNSGMKLFNYLTNVFVNSFKVTLIYGIFALGILAVLGIFIFLILDGTGYRLIARVEILLLGFYYVPALLYVFYKQDEVGKFGKVIIKYVLDTLVMSAFVVIYMYIIKIIFLRDMPSNQIYRILTALFTIGMPIWTMTMAFDEDKLFDKINRKLPLLFTPFVLLQVYSIGVRIIENGITPLRYLCVMLIIFEIVYIAMYIKNKEKVGNILLVFIAMTIISAIIPYINMFYISDVSQYNRFKKNYYGNDDKEYTEEERNNIYGSYIYLKNSSVEGYKYLEDLSDDEKEEIMSLKVSTYKVTTDYESLYASKVLGNIDISGYNNLYIVSAYYSHTTDITELKNLEFEYSDSNGEEKYIKVNLYDLVNSYIENKNNINVYFKANNELQIDNERKIMLKSISLEYNTETGKLDYYSINGYILEK